MTLNEFIERLGRIKCLWVEVAHDNLLTHRRHTMIRSTFYQSEHCPITAVVFDMTGQYFIPGKAIVAGESIGLPKQLSKMIIAAVDDHTRHDKRIREVINNACFKGEGYGRV